MPADLEDLITQAEAARIRNVSRTAIASLIARGNLTVREIGGRKFLKRSEVENYERQAPGPKRKVKATKRKGRKV